MPGKPTLSLHQSDFPSHEGQYEYLIAHSSQNCSCYFALLAVNYSHFLVCALLYITDFPRKPQAFPVLDFVFPPEQAAIVIHSHDKMI